MKRTLCAVQACVFALLVAKSSYGGICWDDTMIVTVNTEPYVGETAQFRFEVTNSDEAGGEGDYVHFTHYETDGKRSRYDRCFGGPVTANLFGFYPVGPGQGWIHTDDGFYNATFVNFDSLGTYANFRFAVHDLVDTGGHPTEFSFSWYHYGLDGPDHSIRLWPTDDPTDGNALFSVSAWNDSCELVVYAPAIFNAPNNIIIGYSQGGVGDGSHGKSALQVLRMVPNPTSGDLRVDYYALPGYGDLEFSIFDIQGRLVYKRILQDEQENTRSLHWSGLDNLGRHVAAGTYFTSLKNSRKSIVRKVVVVR